MRMNWNDTTIKSFVSASEYTGFHEELANQIRPYIKNSKTLCDIGCGLGLIDMHLSKDLDYITCAIKHVISLISTYYAHSLIIIFNYKSR